MANDYSIFLPTSKKEVEARGWNYLDIILFTGDAYIDHPSFGAAVIGRVLESKGYKVAIVPQPNWQDDLRDFKKLGRPSLFFGVTSGAMDSMVNHYTANKKIRSNDSYTPEGKSGRRPDYAVSVYTKILKQLYPNVPVVLGGIEASLRRISHYDYWSDSIKPSILIDSGADLLVYGMGEKSIIKIAESLSRRGKIKTEELYTIPQIAYISMNLDERQEDFVKLSPYNETLKSKTIFAKNFNIVEKESNKVNSRGIIEDYNGRYVIINPPNKQMTTEELDSYFRLPFTKLPHPRYQNKHIPAYEMIKFSINTHRGCFGACSFCTISAHQGKFVTSRSKESILNEIIALTDHKEFKGVISDIGGPTANMYFMKGYDEIICEACTRASCIYPKICKNLNISPKKMLELYGEVDKIKEVKKSFVSSGIRYDLFLNENGFFDKEYKDYFIELTTKHTSGWFKVAPEHTSDKVLKYMGKPSFSLFGRLKEEFDDLMHQKQLKYKIVPYFISSHPGSTSKEMKELQNNKYLKNIKLEQVQDFTPTPMTRSSVIFYSGIDPSTGEPVYVERIASKKLKQKEFFFKKF